MYGLFIICKILNEEVKSIVKTGRVFCELSLRALSESISLSPNLQLGLEVKEALLDQLDVKKALKTL